MRQEVLARNINTGEVFVYNSATEASRKLNLDSSHITKCCRGKRKKHGGYLWSYKYPHPEFWTLYEDQVLKNYVSSGSLEKVIETLPNRSFKEILLRSDYLKIYRKNPSSKTVSKHDLIYELAHMVADDILKEHKEKHI